MVFYFDYRRDGGKPLLGNRQSTKGRHVSSFIDTRSFQLKENTARPIHSLSLVFIVFIYFSERNNKKRPTFQRKPRRISLSPSTLFSSCRRCVCVSWRTLQSKEKRGSRYNCQVCAPDTKWRRLTVFFSYLTPVRVSFSCQRRQFVIHWGQKRTHQKSLLQLSKK